MSVPCFTAILETGGNIGPNQEDTTVVFSKTVTNVGKAYTVSTGLFTAPVAGCYCFSFSYHADKTEPSGLTLMKNDEVILRAFDNHKSGSTYVDNATSTACLQLNGGDRVYVVLPANCHVHGTGNCTSFTGFLISRA